MPRFLRIALITFATFLSLLGAVLVLTLAPLPPSNGPLPKDWSPAPTELAAEWHWFAGNFPDPIPLPDGVVVQRSVGVGKNWQLTMDRLLSDGTTAATRSWDWNERSVRYHAGSIWAAKSDAGNVVLEQLDPKTLNEQLSITIPINGDGMTDWPDAYWAITLLADGPAHLRLIAMPSPDRDKGETDIYCLSARIVVSTAEFSDVHRLTLPRVEAPVTSVEGYVATSLQPGSDALDLRSGTTVQVPNRMLRQRPDDRAILRGMPSGFIPSDFFMQPKFCPNPALGITIWAGRRTGRLSSIVNGFMTRGASPIRKRTWISPAYCWDSSTSNSNPRELSGDLAQVYEWLVHNGSWTTNVELGELDGSRALVTQVVEPAPAWVNGGKGLVRFGTLKPDGDAVEWVAWLPLPETDLVEYVRSVRIHADDDGWFVSTETTDLLSDDADGDGEFEADEAFTHWTRIAPPAGLEGAPRYRWLDKP